MRDRPAGRFEDLGNPSFVDQNVSRFNHLSGQNQSKISQQQTGIFSDGVDKNLVISHQLGGNPPAFRIGDDARCVALAWTGGAKAPRRTRSR